MGAPLLAATFPRAYIDANRAPDEIDELLLDRPWPGAVNASPKVRLGKGLIWRMLDDGTPLYDRKLPVEEVEHRIAACWKPITRRCAGRRPSLGKVWATPPSGGHHRPVPRIHRGLAAARARLPRDGQ